MAISTNSIIHYTDSFDKLSCILIEGFKIKYCAETLNLGANNTFSAAHPMISFCDIPLSASKQHFAAYGDYGIGLTKQWAVKKGVNPVLYIDSNSLLANSLSKLLEEIKNPNTNLTQKQKNEISEIKSYAKNYSGSLTRNSKVIPDYKFYDEREWRLVPKENDMNNAPASVDLSHYNADKASYNNKIADCKFTFEASDVTYIILKSIDEIPNMVDFLRTNCKCTPKAVDTLFTKICSTDEIVSDY